MCQSRSYQAAKRQDQEFLWNHWKVGEDVEVYKWKKKSKLFFSRQISKAGILPLFFYCSNKCIRCSIITNQRRIVKSTSTLVLVSFSWVLANTVFNLMNTFVKLLLRKCCILNWQNFYEKYTLCEVLCLCDTKSSAQNKKYCKRSDRFFTANGNSVFKEKRWLLVWQILAKIIVK